MYPHSTVSLLMCKFSKAVAYTLLMLAVSAYATEHDDQIYKDGFELCRPSDVVQWDGGGDDTSWADPLNWKGDKLPIDGDGVSISGS